MGRTIKVGCGPDSSYLAGVAQEITQPEAAAA